MKNILGINDGHDSGACLLKEGKMIYASNEERFNRQKMFWGFPKLTIESMFESLGLKAKDIDVVAIGTISKPQEFATSGYEKENVGFLKWIFEKVAKHCGSLVESRFFVRTHRFIGKFLRDKKSLEKELNRLDINAPVVFFDHHKCHAASAYYSSGYDKCLIITADAGGDGISGGVYLGENGLVKELEASPRIHSAGDFWKYITIICGFNPYRHGGKITGLAAYEPCDEAYQELSRYYGFSKKRLHFINKKHLFLRDSITFLQKILKEYSREQISNAAQRVLEDNMVGIVSEATKRYSISKVALAGGVFANVKLNQRIIELESVSNVFVHPHMGDGGLGTGAAYLAWHEGNSNFVNKTIENIYLGPDYSDKQIKMALDRYGLTAEYVGNDIEKRIAEFIHSGKVVARFNGRMEYGPRTLGNRSILYRPTDPKVNDWLNKRLKRTEFMPFAPTALIEHAGKLFRNYTKGLESAKFMTIAFNTTNWMKKYCPAVVHVDGTARPQLIDKERNPSYYRILEEYMKLSGLPCIVNTSFNMHEEPIVCSPEDAIRAFKLGHLDVLVIGSFIVKI